MVLAKLLTGHRVEGEWQESQLLFEGSWKKRELEAGLVSHQIGDGSVLHLGTRGSQSKGCDTSSKEANQPAPLRSPWRVTTAVWRVLLPCSLSEHKLRSSVKILRSVFIMFLLPHTLYFLDFKITHKITSSVPVPICPELRLCSGRC